MNEARLHVGVLMTADDLIIAMIIVYMFTHHHGKVENITQAVQVIINIISSSIIIILLFRPILEGII